MQYLSPEKSRSLNFSLAMSIRKRDGTFIMKLGLYLSISPMMCSTFLGSGMRHWVAAQARAQVLTNSPAW